jgi:hypothetical protein
MDELQQNVARLAEKAENNKTDPLETFFQVKALALAARGQDFSIAHALQRYGKCKVLPHLTESWFCCAEPTTCQMTPQTLTVMEGHL